MPQVSVVIPCYNQGHFLAETLASVYAQTYDDLEIIVVNDGSTDPLTLAALATLAHPLVRIIHRDNGGLATARNTGIAAAQGEYILPLDADDLIEPEYLSQAVAVLAGDPEVGIVYCRARLFGAVATEWLLPDYSLAEMLRDNVIFCTALFRRADWEAVGGYDAGMIYGWEDYDFWLSLIERGRKVVKLAEILFAYRVSSDSMVRSKEKWQKVAMFARVFRRHAELFGSHIEVWVEAVLAAGEAYYTSRLYIDYGAGLSDADSISRKVDRGTGQLDFQLPVGKTIQALRFDPADAPVIVGITAITGETETGVEMALGDFSHNALEAADGLLYFDHDDPQIFLDLPAASLSRLRTIRISLTFVAFGAEAIGGIAERQKKTIADLTSEIRQGQQFGLIRGLPRILARRSGESLATYLGRLLDLS